MCKFYCLEKNKNFSQGSSLLDALRLKEAMPWNGLCCPLPGTGKDSLHRVE